MKRVYKEIHTFMFVHYLLVKRLVAFVRQPNLNFLWSSWVKFNIRFLKHL